MTRLCIPIASGVGRGATLLSAFDDALHVCGIANDNLIARSSVIPPAGEVVLIDRVEPDPDEHGCRLYVVKAEVLSVTGAWPSLAATSRTAPKPSLAWGQEGMRHGIKVHKPG